MKKVQEDEPQVSYPRNDKELTKNHLFCTRNMKEVGTHQARQVKDLLLQNVKYSLDEIFNLKC